MTLVKLGSVPVLAMEGNTVTYTFVVKNTGNVTLDNVTVSDAKAMITSPSIATLGVGEVHTFTGTYVLTQSDIDYGMVTNTANVSGTAPNGAVVSDTSGTSENNDDVTATVIDHSGAIALVKVGNTPANAVVGSTVTYTLSVENTGNVTLSNVTVSDAKATIANPSIASLSVGSVHTFTGTYVLTQADIDSGIVTNTAQVTAMTPNSAAVSSTVVSDTSGTSKDNDDVTATAIVQAPAMTLVKSSLAPVAAMKGDEVAYIFVVHNTGNVTLRDIKVSDQKVANITPATIPSLPVGERITLRGVYVLKQSDIDSGVVTNTATVAAKDPNGSTVSDVSGTTEDNDDVTVTTIKKTALVTLVKTGVTPDVSAVGNTISYTFVVRNTGNVTLHNVRVEDARVAGISPAEVLKLEPRETVTLTAAYVITQADMDAGVVTNTATVVATTQQGEKITDVSDDNTPDTDVNGDGDLGNDPTVLSLTSNPQISVSQTADKEEVGRTGEIVVYTITVTNTGDVTLYDVLVQDPLTGLSEVIAELPVGDSVVFTTEYQVTEEDIRDDKEILNGVSAAGTSLQGEQVTSEAENRIPFFCPQIAEDFVIPQVVSPNNDGYNEGWEIPELVYCKVCGLTNKVMIFNRWGAKVYEKENYMLDEDRFRGFSTNTLDLQDGETLPAGVYFYIIEISGQDNKTGYFYILEK